MSGPDRQRNPVARAFRVLAFMAERQEASWGVRQLAASLGMNASTLHRLLGALEAEGLVRQEAETGRYALGMGFLRVVWLAATRESLAGIALPALRGLRDATGETALLGVYDRGEGAMMLIAAAESHHAVRNVRPLHTWMPVHGGASGRALLASLSGAEREAILAGPLAAVTDATVTDPGALRRNLDDVRRRGYAVSHGERVAGGVGIAAPVLAGGGRLVGVVGITMPEQRYSPADEPRLVGLVLAAARAVAGALEPGAGDETAKRTGAGAPSLR